jgi:glycosyltransferase involved in cell wall biosynthesis
MPILVSICCLSYNHEPYIKECLEGFLKQKTDFDFEILIHDDASTDNTQSIIKEYEVKYPEIIKPICQTENQWSQGINPSRRFNYSRVQGKYIAMCEGDDYWTDPSKLQKQVDFLEKNEDYAVVYHNSQALRENGKLDSTLMLKHTSNKSISKLDVINQPIPTLTILYRNLPEIIEDFNIVGIVAGDVVLRTLISRFGKGKYLHNITPAVYRIHAGGTSSSQSMQKRFTDSLNAKEFVLNHFKQKGWEHAFIQQNMTEQYLNAFLSIFKKDKKIHWSFLKKSLYYARQSNRSLLGVFIKLLSTKKQ